MNNFKQIGETMTFTAPSGGVVSGKAYLIGAILVVAANAVAQTLPFPGAAEGVFTLDKATGTAWTEGELLYWDDTAKKITTVATGNTRVGVAVAAALSAATTGDVRLSGAPAPVHALPDPIVEDTGTITASATVALTKAASMIQSTRVVTSGTAGSVGSYLVADSGATPVIPTGGASLAPGVAKISADGLTLTFPNTVTRVVTQYIPRAAV